jgi:hypothetical protein
VYRGMTMGKRKRKIAVGMSGGACSGMVRWVVVGAVVGRTPRTLWQVV